MDFRHYRYSSYQTLVKAGNASAANAQKIATKINTDPILSWFGGVSPFVHAHEFSFEKNLRTEDLRGFKNLVGLDDTE
jgi:hypothetical protein